MYTALTQGSWKDAVRVCVYVCGCIHMLVFDLAVSKLLMHGSLVSNVFKKEIVLGWKSSMLHWKRLKSFWPDVIVSASEKKKCDAERWPYCGFVLCLGGRILNSYYPVNMSDIIGKYEVFPNYFPCNFNSVHFCFLNSVWRCELQLIFGIMESQI